MMRVGVASEVSGGAGFELNCFLIAGPLGLTEVGRSHRAMLALLQAVG